MFWYHHKLQIFNSVIFNRIITKGVHFITGMPWPSGPAHLTWVQMAESPECGFASSPRLVSLSKTLYRNCFSQSRSINGYLTKAVQVTCDRLAHHPGGIEIFSVVSCRRINTGPYEPTWLVTDLTSFYASFKGRS